MNRIWAAVVLVAVGGFATQAHANAIPIYNTGVSGSGLAANESADAHWTVVSSPAGASSTAYVKGSTDKPGSWANSATSQWISANAAVNGFGANGAYGYQTAFSLAGLDYTTAQLTGSFAVDNCVTDILINGVSTGVHSGDAAGACTAGANYSTFFGFSIASGFISGLNTITFLIKNTGGAGGNPSGLNVQISGTALPIPEPAALGVLGLGILGFAGLWLRRRQTA